MEIKFNIDRNERGSFYIEKDAVRIAELNFETTGNLLNAYRTWVQKEFEGQGIAGRLFDEMVAYAQEKGYRVVPSCSYILIKFRRNPEKFASIWHRTNDEPMGRACGIKPKAGAES